MPTQKQQAWTSFAHHCCETLQSCACKWHAISMDLFWKKWNVRLQMSTKPSPNVSVDQNLLK
jgi:hypothetical protein